MDDSTLLNNVQRLRRSRYSARPFALTILAISLISLLAWAPSQAAAGGALRKRGDLSIKDEECRLVHHAKDQ